MYLFRDVLELQVSEFADASAGFPQVADEGFVARIVADAQECLNIGWR